MKMKNHFSFREYRLPIKQKEGDLSLEEKDMDKKGMP